MKKLLVVGALALGINVLARAADIPVSSSAFSGVLSSTQNIDVDMNANRIDMLSIQLNVSSESVASFNFTDGTPSTGSITISTQNLTQLSTAFATDMITVISSASQTAGATAQITINSTTSLSGTTLTFSIWSPSTSWYTQTLTAGTDFAVDASTMATAADLAKTINSAFSGILVASNTSSKGIVYTTSAVIGVISNSFTVVPSSTIISTTSFSGGIDDPFLNATLTVSANGVTQVLKNGSDWFESNYASMTAISIRTALNNNWSSVFVSSVANAETGATIFSTAVVAGTAANAFTITSSTPAALSVASSNFSGGQDNAVIKINGYPLTANKDWWVMSTATATAKSISDDIMNVATTTSSSLLSTYIRSTWTIGTSNFGVVWATSNFAGAFKNYQMSVSTSLITLSSSSMTGGTSSQIYLSFFFPDTSGMLAPNVNYNNLPTGVLQQLPTWIPNAIIGNEAGVWGTGTPLLLTKTAGTYPSPLADKTTYYAFNINTQTFQLARTSTDAFAGNAIVITTQTVGGNGKFVLTPLAISNSSATLVMQTSDDDVNFTPLYVSTNVLVAPFAAQINFGSPYATTSQKWDIGNIFFRWLRLAYTNAVNNGGVVLNYIINGKGYAQSNR